MEEAEQKQHFAAQLPYLRPLLPSWEEQTVLYEKHQEALARIAALVAEGWTAENARRIVIGLRPLAPLFG